MIYGTDYYSSAWLALEGKAGASYTVSTQTENAAPPGEQPWWNTEGAVDTNQAPIDPTGGSPGMEQGGAYGTSPTTPIPIPPGGGY